MCTNSLPQNADKATEASVIRRGGQKRTFQNAEEQQAADQRNLDDKLTALHKSWAVPRGGRDLAAAVWDMDSALAQVTRATGKLLPRMGFLYQGKLHLHPEEAIYLADRGDMLLLAPAASGPELLTLAESTALMVASGVPLSCYIVYSHLMRSGFIVQRHPAHWALDSAQEPAAAWPNWLRRCHLAGQQLSAPEPDATTERSLALQRQPMAGSAPGASVPGLHFPDLQLQSPLLAGDHAKLHADTSPPPAATQSIEWARQLPNEDVQMASLPAGGHARAGEAQSVSMRHWWPLPGILNDSYLAQVPMCVPTMFDRLRSEVGPVQEVGRELHALQPFPGVALAAEEARAQHSLLAFDVFRPNNRFSRKNPDQPVAVVCMGSSRPPSLAQLLVTEAAGAVPHIWANVVGGTVSFFSLEGGCQDLCAPATLEAASQEGIELGQ